MTNKEYANTFNFLGKLMELHEESSYKTKAYYNAYRTLRGETDPIQEMPLKRLKEIRGVGDAIAQKIQELQADGQMTLLNRYLEMTPKGLQDMVNIKGLGVKKIQTLWKELDIVSPGELLYACNENRLVTLKGFGEKTQENLRKQLEYFMRSKDKFRYAQLEQEAEELLEDLEDLLGDIIVSLTGEMRRKMPVVKGIEIVIGTLELPETIFSDLLELEDQKDGIYLAKTKQGSPVKLFTCSADTFGSMLLHTTGSETFVEALKESFLKEDDFVFPDEESLFEAAGIPFVEPELRETKTILFRAQADKLPVLVEATDVKGVLHAHSTWSDGGASLKQMAEYAKTEGYQYLGITDHSKSAFYANGLKPDRVLQQMEEIDQLNFELAPFKIYKGIESDILGDGSLDYDEDMLSKFDFIIASVHAHLRMDKEKATARILAAVRNPYTTILGHPTGRLLLSREGYPLDHEVIIDACAKHGVIIELNASPYRLDLDWTHITYALEKGVKISINPDAHSLEGIHDIHFGVCAARKGGLTAEMCFNSLSKEEFEAYCNQRKTSISGI